MQNKFCPMPFGSMHIDPNGQIKICCSDSGDMLDEQGRQFNVQTHTLKEAWNSNHYKKIRLEFLAGQQPKSCFQCWDNEVGDQGKSTRTSSLDLYKKMERKGYDLQGAINEAKNTNGEINSSFPADFQVMSGNLCNLSCKMCYPIYSNSWSKFYTNKNINVREIKFHSRIGDPEKIYPNFGVVYDWPKTLTLKRIFSEFADYIYHINITGGEPTLLEENIEFIEFLKTSKNFKNLELMVITNTTNINKRLLDAIQDFSEITLINSLDGMDEIAYIQRTPSNWPQIYKNFKTLRKFAYTRPNINHCIITVVTALNIHHIGKFWDYLISQRINMFEPGNISAHFVVQDKQNVGLGIVPKNVIKKIREEFVQIESLKDTPPYYRVLNYIDNMTWADDDTAMLEMLDSIQKLHPELNIRELYSIYYE